MNAQNKNVKDRLKIELSALADLAAKEEGVHYSIEQSEDVLKMLKWASEQSDACVRRLLPRIGKHMNSGHRRFFENNGVSFSIFPEAKDVTLAIEGGFAKIESPSTEAG